MLLEPKLLTTLILFPVIFLSGFWLRKQGWAYPTLLLTLHKLAGLAAGVLLILLISSVWAHITAAAMGLAVVLLSGALFLLAGATGGWLSAAQKAPRLAKVSHLVTPFLALIASGMLIYLLLTGYGL